MDIMKQVNEYVPFTEQERRDKEVILKLIASEEDFYLRSNEVAHITVSAWVVNPEMNKVLMVYHNIFKSWSWVGGHADGEHDLTAVALRETEEETGLTSPSLYSKDIFSLEILPMFGHEKKHQYVSSHLHLNFTYLVIADENSKLRICTEENSDVKWFKLEDVSIASSEEWLKDQIYSKLIRKIEKIKNSY